MDILSNYIPANTGLDAFKKSVKRMPVLPSSHADGNSENTDIKKVAKEMEALFIHELIKVMRRASGSASSEEHGLGKDTYMDLFDMELSKVMSERGVGLQKSLEDFLNKKIDEHAKVNKNIDEK
ncbi:MAG: hypothetical protein C4538_08295 [Nitrospiraceae bacterium]|nr:MAG: hypothetical protein C4538_08295 [Nitrospiraceae bacterium]